MRARIAAELSSFGLSVSTLQTLHATDKSQVYLTSSKEGASLVLKRHAFAEAYRIESVALSLCRATDCTGRMFFALDGMQTIAMEYLPQAFAVDSEDALCAVAYAMATVHHLAGLREHVLTPFVGDGCLARLAETRTYLSWVPEPDWFSRLLAVSVDFFGADYIPVSLGDIKCDHLKERDGRCVFIDLDGFRIGVPEQVDLVSLINVAPPTLEKMPWPDIAMAYCLGRGWTDEASWVAVKKFIELALRAFSLQNWSKNQL